MRAPTNQRYYDQLCHLRGCAERARQSAEALGHVSQHEPFPEILSRVDRLLREQRIRMEMPVDGPVQLSPGGPVKKEVKHPERNQPSSSGMKRKTITLHSN